MHEGSKLGAAYSVPQPSPDVGTATPRIPSKDGEPVLLKNHTATEWKGGVTHPRQEFKTKAPQQMAVQPLFAHTW